MIVIIESENQKQNASLREEARKILAKITESPDSLIHPLKTKPLTDYNYDSNQAADAIIRQLEQIQPIPDIVLFPSTFLGRELAAAVSARMKRALLTDCTELTVTETEIIGAKPYLDGKNMSLYSFTGPKPYLVLMKNIADSQGIQDAEFIISGGRGLMNSDSFDAMRELAGHFKAAVGGSRPVVDCGWATPEEQVGQTGYFVKPRVYLAFGISGAVQHLAGMKDSQVIIAVNNNDNSPLLGHSDYWIKADANSIIRNMLQQIRKETNTDNH